MIDGFTKEWHRAKVGTTEPALCGERPPGGRAWKAAPKTEGNDDVLPRCEACEARYEAIAAGSMWLAA